MKRVPIAQNGLPLLVITIFCSLVVSASSDKARRVQPSTTEPTETAQAINYRLEDISAQLGLRELSSTWSASTSDFNNDGLPDIVIVWHKPHPEGLYLNRGADFERLDFGYSADRHHCTPGDVNQDGREDIYCTVGARRGAGQGNNNLFVQQEDGSFLDRAESYGVQDPFGRGRWAVFLNANGDVYPDLFVTNTPGRSDGETSASHLYINEAGKRLRSAEEYGVDNLKASRCLIAEDINSDGFDDLLICGGQLALYLNSHGKRYVKASEKIVTKSHWPRAVFSDMNNDDVVDLLVLNKNTLQIILQQEGKFERILFETTFIDGMDLTVGDVEGDGDNDIYIVQAGCDDNRTDAQGNFPERPDFLLINKGAGIFHKVFTPQVQKGCGRAVLPVDYNNDGDTEFLVLNGSGKSKGHVQFIDLQRPEDTRDQDDAVDPVENP